MARGATAWTFEAIGTSWRIDLFEPVGQAQQVSLRRRIDRRIEQFDQAYSRFRPDSLVSRMAAAAGTYELPADARPMLELYRRLYDLSSGKITPLIGQTMVDTGYDADYSLRPKAVIAQAPRWDDILSYDHPRLTSHQPTLLDVGAAGKGHLVDIVAGLIAADGVAAFAVDAGGDMLHHHPTGPAWRVGLEHPLKPGQAIGVVELKGRSLCGSAGNRRAWDVYHHIMDPDTARPADSILATWVIADTTLVADGLATALFFVSPARLVPHFQFEYGLVRADQSFEYSPGLQPELFS